MDVLVTCQYEEDPIKNRGARVFTTLYINLSDAQGQISLELVLVSGQNLNSSKHYITNVDLVNDYVYAKVGLNRSICFQDIEQKLNSDANQGP